MTENKKNFIKAGSILAIIMAAFFIITGICLIPAGAKVTEESIIQALVEEDEGIYYDNADGTYYIEFPEDGIKMTQEDVKWIENATRKFSIVIGLIIILFESACLTIAILNLVKLDKGEYKKGLIIASLVLAILNGNTITMAFMITVLCIKDKPKPTLENINEIANKE